MNTLKRLNHWLGLHFGVNEGARLWTGIEGGQLQLADDTFRNSVLLEAPIVTLTGLNTLSVGPWRGRSNGNPIVKTGAADLINFENTTHGSLIGPVDTTDHRVIIILARYTTADLVDVVDLMGIPQKEETHHSYEYRIIMGANGSYGVDDLTPPDLATEIAGGSIPIAYIVRKIDTGIQQNYKLRTLINCSMYQTAQDTRDAINATVHDGVFCAVSGTNSNMQYAEKVYIATGIATIVSVGAAYKARMLLSTPWFGRINEMLIHHQMYQGSNYYLETGDLPTLTATAYSLFLVLVRENGGIFVDFVCREPGATPGIGEVQIGTLDCSGATPVLTCTDRTPVRTTF